MAEPALGYVSVTSQSGLSSQEGKTANQPGSGYVLVTNHPGPNPQEIRNTTDPGVQPIQEVIVSTEPTADQVTPCVQEEIPAAPATATATASATTFLSHPTSSNDGPQFSLDPATGLLILSQDTGTSAARDPEGSPCRGRSPHRSKSKSKKKKRRRSSSSPSSSSSSPHRHRRSRHRKNQPEIPQTETLSQLVSLLSQSLGQLTSAVQSGKNPAQRVVQSGPEPVTQETPGPQPGDEDDAYSP